MAISKVRAKFNGQWYTLTFNASTGRYEASIKPTEPSYMLSGGYYNTEIEVTNSSGKVVTADGSKFSGLRLVVSETTAPAITLVSPAAGYLSNNRPTVVMTAVDEGSGINISTLSVKLDGAAISGVSTTAISGGYRITITPPSAWAEGAHTLTVSVKDQNGNPAALNVSYTVDTVPPELTVQTPAEGEVTDQSSVTVSGTVQDLTSGVKSVTINGQAVTVSGVGYSGAVELTEGQNTIVVQAVDQLGNQSQVTRTVYLDTSPPVLTMIYPVDGAFVKTSSFSLTGTAVDIGSGLASVTVNGQPATVAADSTFTYPVSLPEGPHSFTVVAVDNAGYRSSLTLNIVVDTVPPALEAWENRKRMIVDEASVIITGLTSDATSPPVTVKLVRNGADAGAAEVYASGLFVQTVPLEVGLNEIAVTAVDGASWETQVTIPVIRLITDRRNEDLAALKELLAVPAERWTESQRTEFYAAVSRGAYNYTDVNRVVLAEQYLADALNKAGYAVELTAADGWTETDPYPAPEAERYLADLKAVRNAGPVLEDTPDVPKQIVPGGLKTADGLTLEKANDIEKILVMTDSALALAGLSVWYSGEIFSGEV